MFFEMLIIFLKTADLLKEMKAESCFGGEAQERCLVLGTGVRRGRDKV